MYLQPTHEGLSSGCDRARVTPQPEHVDSRRRETAMYEWEIT